MFTEKKTNCPTWLPDINCDGMSRVLCARCYPTFTIRIAISRSITRYRNTYVYKK
jgi:hypothetical protein